MTTHVQATRRLVVHAMLSLSVFGCGWFGADQPVEKDPNDYLQAESEPDLQVPADLVSRPDLDPFPVPQIPTQKQKSKTDQKVTPSPSSSERRFCGKEPPYRLNVSKATKLGASATQNMSQSTKN